jgi:hypothetical protein
MNKNTPYILGYVAVLGISIYILYAIKKKRDAEIDAKIISLDEAIKRYNELNK